MLLLLPLLHERPHLTSGATPPCDTRRARSARSFYEASREPRILLDQTRLAKPRRHGPALGTLAAGCLRITSTVGRGGARTCPLTRLKSASKGGGAAATRRGRGTENVTARRGDRRAPYLTDGGASTNGAPCCRRRMLLIVAICFDSN